MESVIGIDLRCLPTDGTAGSGVAHAARAITEALVRQLGDRVILYVPRGAAIGSVGAHCNVPLQDTRRSSLTTALQRHPCAQLFVPSGAVPYGLPVPAIPWVHDCDIFDHPEWFPQSWLKRQLTTRLFLRGIRRAPHVFAVSAYTQRAIERLVPSAAGHITVTGEGGDATLASIPADELAEHKSAAALRLSSRGISRQFALILGTVEPRKNIPLISGMWPDIARAMPGTDFVVAGQNGWKTEPIRVALYDCSARLEGLDSRGIRLKEFSEEDRRDLLLAADLVLVPSYSEGFGLVAFEAIQAGTLVLASDRGGLPEVLGPGPWLLDPDDAIAWKDRIVSLLEDRTMHREWVAQQAARRDVFSWEGSARRIVEVSNR